MFDAFNKQLNSYVLRTVDSGVEPLEINFEPVFDLSYGEPIAYRAWLKVNSIISGVILPESYMRLGADEKTLADVSLRAVKKTVRALSELKAAGVDIKLVFVKCSVALFERADLYGDLKSLWGDSEEFKNRICLEFFCEAYEYDAEALERAFCDIRAAGLKVAVSGYGGENFPIEKLIKICPDYVFTSKEFSSLTTDREKRSAVAPLINLVKGLGGKIVAEGVSSDDELREFRSRDCFGFIPSESYRGGVSAVKKTYRLGELTGGGDERS